MVVFTDYEGRFIRLTDERWRHIEQHPEMRGFWHALAETLSEPEIVVESLSDPEATLYYRFYSQTIVGGKHLCVVAKNWRRDDAFMVTAYLTDRVKKGNVLWRRQP